MKQLLKKPSVGGEVLLQKHGPKYFSKLAKDGWKKRREEKMKWEKEQKKLSAKTK